MLKAIQGIYRNGQIELAEKPELVLSAVEGNVQNDTPVIVTFLTPTVYLRDYVRKRRFRIDQEQAAELRERLTTFVEDWNNPEMDVYDDYESAKSRLSSG